LISIAETTAAQAVPLASAVTSVNCADPEKTKIDATTGAAVPQPFWTASAPYVTASRKVATDSPAP
jgi:hypothetical protein